MKLRVNAPVEQAGALLERFAQLGLQAELIETTRGEKIAAANAAADQELLPILQEQQKLAVVLEPWWMRNGAALLPKGRKSMELGGCSIGSKAGSTKLEFAHGDDAAALAALQAQRWAKPYVRVIYSIDKAATGKALAGKDGEKLRDLGFGLSAASDVFVLKRAVQEGTARA